MSEKLEIYPKKEYGFYALPWPSRTQTDDITKFLETYELEINEEDGVFYVDGHEEDDTAEIKPGEYLVACGPYWDVLTLSEINDDFRIG